MYIKKIENLFYNKIKVEIEPSKLDINSTSFIIKCKNKVYRNLNLEIQKHINLFCFNDSNEKISLYDCSVVINQLTNNFITSFKIIYNKIIIGNHFERLDNIYIDSMDAIIDNSVVTYRTGISNNNWNIDNYTIHTEWNKNINCKFDGVKISIKSNNEKSSLEKYLYVFDNIICIFYLSMGFFPDKKEIILNIDNKKCLYINPNESLYLTSDSINIISELNFDLSNFPIIYKKWNAFYIKNLTMLHMYFDIQKSHNFEEVKTFNYIQCLEALFTNNIYEQLFSDSYKEKIKTNFREYLSKDKKNNLVKELLKTINDINKNGNVYTYEMLTDTLQGKLNDINEMSLNKKINNIFENEYAKLIFKYEDGNNIIKFIKEKTYNHRNFMAHINKNTKYFIGDENKLMQNKFKLLIRVIIMSLIDMNIDDECLKKYISYINNWYKDNKFLIK